MSKNRNRTTLDKSITDREYRLMLYEELYPIYWDECKRYYGNKLSYQVRRYKTWKHNRKTQWKE